MNDEFCKLLVDADKGELFGAPRFGAFECIDANTLETVA